MSRLYQRWVVVMVYKHGPTDYSNSIRLDIKTKRCLYCFLIAFLIEVVRMDVLLQLGFGKSLATNCVWLEGVEKTMSRKFLVGQLSRYGQVLWCDIDRETHRAIVYMESQDVAAVTIASLKERAVAGVTLQVTIFYLPFLTLTLFHLKLIFYPYI